MFYNPEVPQPDTNGKDPAEPTTPITAFTADDIKQARSHGRRCAFPCPEEASDHILADMTAF